MPRGFKHPVTTLSPEAKQFKAEVRIRVREAGIVEPLPGRVSMTVQLYPQRPQDWIRRAQRDPQGWDEGVRSVDLDNALKVLLDSLKGLVFGDDRMVYSISATRCEPDGEGRMVVHVAPIVREPVQPALFCEAA